MEGYRPSNLVVIGICVVVGTVIIGLLIKAIMQYASKTPEDYQCERARRSREIQRELSVLYSLLYEAQVQKPAAAYQTNVAYAHRNSSRGSDGLANVLG